MLSRKVLLFAVLIAGIRWEAWGAAVPFLEIRSNGAEPEELPGTMRVKVAEGAPALLCAGLCNAPPHISVSRGPVCAFDAAGTARTFATLCELEAASCHDSTFYAIASIGEC